MANLLVKHRVKDYAKWKAEYDANGDTRGANGSKGARLFRNAADPNEIVVLFEWDDLGNARRFTESPELREAMERAGVTGPPDLYFLDEVEQTLQ